MALNLNHQTAAEFAARLRARFRNSSRVEAARVAYFIIEKLNAGEVTDAQLRNVFELTVQQWDTLKVNKLIPLHDAWAIIRQADGA